MRQNYSLPKYMEVFKCDGDKCKDLCCKTTWNIYLNKKTTKFYINHANNRIRELAKRNIEIIDEDNPKGYAKIKAISSDAQLCGFCDEETHLCQIHKVLGEKNLCPTCYSYPKIVNVINGQKELSASMSCSEVVKPILLMKDGLDIINKEIDYDNELLGTHHYTNTQDLFDIPEHAKVFGDIREISLEIMKDRSLTIQERLAYLGLWHVKLQRGIDANNISQMQNVITDYREQNIVSSKQQLEPESETNILRGLSILLKVLNILFDSQMLKEDAYYKGILGEVVQDGFNKYKEQDEYDYRTIKEAYEGCLDEGEELLERYIMSYMYTQVYPINWYKDNETLNQFKSSYLLLIVHVALVKMHLIGIYLANQKPLTIDDYIKVIQGLTKVMDHNNTYLKNVITTFKQNRIYSLSWMKTLASL